MKVTVIGAGFVGLPLAARFALDGHTVNLVDKDKDKLSVISSGKSPFYEEGLDRQLAEVAGNSLKTFHSQQLKDAVAESRFIFLCVPTPSRADGSCNTDYLEAAGVELAPHLRHGQIAVVKSTVYPGTTRKLYTLMQKHAKDEFDIAMNPEFMAEGTACINLEKPNRIVFGRINMALDIYAKQLYKAQLLDDSKKLLTVNSFESAELIKYGSNASLADKVARVAELARLAEKVPGADIREVAAGMALDERIGKHFLHPSKHGYGGSCFDKDVKGLQKIGESFGLTMHLSKANHESNAYCIEDSVNGIVRYFEGSVKDQIIGVWGLAFKQGTDDVRNSQQLEVVKRLLGLGAIIQAHDPKALENARPLCERYPNFRLKNSRYLALEKARALIVQTEWAQYRNLEFDELQSLMDMRPSALIADHKTIYNAQEITDAGFDYLAAGRPFKKAGSKPETFHRELPELK